MDGLNKEIGDFRNQVVGTRVVSYNGKLVPGGSDIINEREYEEDRRLEKEILSILNDHVDDSDNEKYEN